MGRLNLWHSLLLVFLLSSSSADSQGIYTKFGENRVVFKQIQWQTLITPSQDVLFFEKGNDSLAIVMQNMIDLEKKLLQRQMGYAFRGKLKMAIFTNFSDYSASNFGIINHQYNAGGYLYAPQNEIFVYFNGSYIDLNRQIKKGMAACIIHEMIMGSSMLERAQSSSLFTLPTWLSNGLASFLAEPWSTERDNLMRDAIMNNYTQNFAHDQKDEDEFYGHALWYFINDSFGFDVIKNILFQIRYSHNPVTAIQTYTGMTLNRLIRERDEFFRKTYLLEEAAFSIPKGAENKLGQNARHVHTGISISPGGDKLAFVTNNRGLYKVWIYYIAKRKAKVLLAGGFKTFSREPNSDYPVVKWASNDQIAVLYEKKSEQRLILYEESTGNKSYTLPLTDFDWVKDFAVHSEKQAMVISAIKNGKTNLYYKTQHNNSFIPLTNDIYDKKNLSFDAFGNILYASNKPGKANPGLFLQFNAPYGVFMYNIGQQQVTRITPDDIDVHCQSPIHLGGDQYSFLSDLNGVFNSYAVRFTGTTTRYEDFYLLTHYHRGILFQDVSPIKGVVAEMLFTQGKYRIFITPFNRDNPIAESITKAYTETHYRKKMGSKKTREALNREEAPFTKEPETPPTDPAEKADTEIEQHQENKRESKSKNEMLEQADFQVPFPQIDYHSEREMMHDSRPRNNNGLRETTKQHFTIDYLQARASDMTILNDYYFQSGATEDIMVTPLLSPYLSISVSDMMNDRVLEAGLRIAGLPLASGIYGADYYMQYTNRKERINRTLFFHRRGRFINDGNPFERNICMQGGGGASYPLHERARIDGRLLMRSDRHIVLGIDESTLNREDDVRLVIGGGLAFVYDNTLSRGVNRLVGHRFKWFADVYRPLSSSTDGLLNSNAVMIGADMRNYLPLGRHLILAQRWVINISAAALKTKYILGGVENQFDIQEDENIKTYEGNDILWASPGAPLRGFLRNARTGSHYTVFNTELRLPVFPAITNRPIRNEILRTFMLVAFTDMGTAWVGRTPYGDSNPYNTVVFSSPQMDVTATAKRNPWVLGAGIGARVKLLSFYCKYDMAWGFMEGQQAPQPLQHISFGLDF
jgi:hypothetical protein